MIIKPVLIQGNDAYVDDLAEALTQKYNFSSYKGIMTLNQEDRKFDPWLFASSVYGGIVGLTKGQKINFIMPNCPPIEDYNLEVSRGLLRLTEPKIGTFSGPLTGGFDNIIYFPTEDLVRRVLDKK